MNILNTGYDFKHIKNRIETSYKEQFSKDIKIKQIRTINQSKNNCVEASKLYTIVLTEKYKQNFGDLEKLSERLNKFEEFIEDTLNKTEEEQKDILNNFREIENIEMLKTVLETNVELFNKHEKHFYKMDKRLKNFYKAIRKIDKTINNAKDKIIDDKMEEMYNVTNVIGLGHEINKMCELKKINNEYKNIIDYIINNTKEIQTNSKINKIEALKKNKILLKIIYYNILYQNNKKIENINKILKDNKKTTETIFKDCIEEIGNLKKEKLQIIK